MHALALVVALAQPAAPSVAATTPSTAAPEPTAGSPVSVTATPSKSEVTVGETFALELKATGPAGTTYTFAAEASADALEIRTPPPPHATSGPAAVSEPGTHRYEATVYALGEVQLPALPVRYKLPDGTTGEAASAPLTLKVVSLLPKDAAEQKLADIRGPAAVAIGAPFWIALALALLLVAALVVWLLRRRRRSTAPAAAPIPDVPADVEALRALDALAAEGLPARGELRAFYIRLAAVAKRYLERRLSAPILEMTSAETVSFLRDHPHGGGLLPAVRELAEAADRVKFAKGEGIGPEAERHLQAVRALVGALETALRPPAADAGPEGRAA
jgi:hypothetical protein